MPRIWLRNDALSSKSNGDTIDLIRDNAARLPEKFGTPNLANLAEVQTACKAWYPTKLRGEDLSGYELTRPDLSDPLSDPTDVVFAPVGEHSGGSSEFRPSDRLR